MIKTILLDVDGVMTSGRKYYDNKGQVVAKGYCDKDWTAIKRFQAIGVNVICITGDPFNKKVILNHGIPVIICRENGKYVDKSRYFHEVSEKYASTPEEICVVGDDLYDLNLMLMVEHRYCLLDSPSDLKKYCDVLSCKGGENAVMVLYERLEAFDLIEKVDWQKALKTIYKSL